MNKSNLRIHGPAWLALLSALLLVACGGGGGAGTPTAAGEDPDATAQSAVEREIPLATAASDATVGWIKRANAGETLASAAPQFARYGRDTTWVYKRLTVSTVCNGTNFPGPVAAGVQQCDVWVPPTTNKWAPVAETGQSFAMAAATSIRYGFSTFWIWKDVTGSIKCDVATFTDPAPGRTKRCVAYTGAGLLTPPPPPPPTSGVMTQLDAHRLADQATFGASETLLAQMRTQSPAAFVKAQMALTNSRYTSGKGDEVDKNVQEVFFCDRAPFKGEFCWRDYFSTEPLMWDFYRNAMTQPDQLRQRVALALSQIAVISGLEVEGTYGLRGYHNMLLEQSFTNYRQLLKKVTLSPMMGEYLNHVNNDRAAPNENYPRELLQLFAIGTCELNLDGTLKTGRCVPTYNNETVREYAYALTGWTFPAGGNTIWGCWPEGANCTYRVGDMVAVARYHDDKERRLLSGVTLPAARTAPQALEKVLDSLMAHPNIAPFIGRQLVQHLVTSNPTPAYVQRVAQAFNAGRYTDAATGTVFGTGTKGDLAATVAAVLLDADARNPRPGPDAGKLREPILMMTNVLRALNGRSDGAALGWWWGETFRQHVFRSPSVFNYYSPSYPLTGTNLVAPAFGIHNANSALNRLNYLTWLLDWGGSGPEANVPGALGTKVDLTAFVSDAADAPKLVDRLSLLALGEPLPAAARTQVLNAVQVWTAQTDTNNWQNRRVQTAAYLIYGSPLVQVQR